MIKSVYANVQPAGGAQLSTSIAATELGGLAVAQLPLLSSELHSRLFVGLPSTRRWLLNYPRKFESDIETFMMIGIKPARLCLTLAAVPLLPPAPSFAQTFDVKQLEVTKGAVDYGPENMFARGLGEGANRHANEQALFYGLTSWWKISGAIKFEQPRSEDVRLTGVAASSLFVLKPIDDKKVFDVGLGWFTELAGAARGDATNALVFGVVPAIKLEKIALTSNLFLEKTFGQNREEGIAFTYGWQVKYQLRDGLGVGVEGFGVIDNLGNAPPWSGQEHRVGPVVYTQLELGNDVKVGIDLGLLYGLTPTTADLALKLNFNVPIYQSRSAAR